MKDRIRQAINHQGHRRYFKNTGWQFLGKFISMLASFFTAVYVIRYLGPKNLGILNYSLSLVGIFGFLASLGIENILYRDLVNRPEDRDRLLGTAFILRLVGGVLAVSAVSVSLIFLDNSTFINHIVLIIAFAFLLQPFSVIASYFQSKVQSKGMAIASVLSIFCLALIKLALVYFHKGLYYFAAVFLLEPLLYALGYWWLYRREKLSARAWRFDKGLAKKIISGSWPLMFSTVFAAVYSRIDQIMLKQYLGEYTVGIYSVAAQLSEYWYFIPIGIVSSLLPAIINGKKAGDAIYRKRLARLMLLVSSVAVLAGLFCTFFGTQLIVILYGNSYMPAGEILKIYIWAGVGMSLGYVSNQFLVVEDRTRLLFIMSLVGMLTNVVLNIFLIPWLGMKGAAMATLVSYSIMPLPLLSSFLKYNKTIQYE